MVIIIFPELTSVPIINKYMKERSEAHAHVNKISKELTSPIPIIKFFMKNCMISLPFSFLKKVYKMLAPVSPINNSIGKK